MLIGAGRPIRDAAAHVARYTGLQPEQRVWAFGYFHALFDPDPDHVRPEDVANAGVLHAGLDRADLTLFAGGAPRIDRALAALPTGVDLADLSDVGPLLDLAQVTPEGRLSILTKVLHRKQSEFFYRLERNLLGNDAVHDLRDVVRLAGTEPFPVTYMINGQPLRQRVGLPGVHGRTYRGALRRSADLRQRPRHRRRQRHIDYYYSLCERSSRPRSGRKDASRVAPASRQASAEAPGATLPARRAGGVRRRGGSS